MTTAEKVTTVKTKIHKEPTLDVIEWECPKCEHKQKQYAYRVKDTKKLQCENCRKIFIIEK